MAARGTIAMWYVGQASALQFSSVHRSYAQCIRMKIHANEMDLMASLVFFQISYVDSCVHDLPIVVLKKYHWGVFAPSA